VPVADPSRLAEDGEHLRMTVSCGTDALGWTWDHKRKLLLTAFAIAVFTLFGVAAYVGARPAAAGWREIEWPFPRDGWPAGRAFHCAVASCGDEVELYVRPKIGFCNCDSGVADDDEVDRVADLDLISERFDPLEPGNAVRLAGMAGRTRQYDLHAPDGARYAAVGIAVSRRCDLIVAAARGKGAASKIQRVALDFLGSEPMRRWITSAPDGR
jgi:hypothetical protein